MCHSTENKSVAAPAPATAKVETTYRQQANSLIAFIEKKAKETGKEGDNWVKSGIETLKFTHGDSFYYLRGWEGTIGRVAGVFGMTLETLYRIGEGKEDGAKYLKPVIKVEPVKVEEVKMGAKEKAKVKKAAKATTRILPGGVKRIIHVFAPALKERFEGNKDNKLCCVRNANNLTRRYMYKKVECLGPSQLVELDEPLPGTNGRGICVMVTTEAIRVHY